jgi:hypothetical protein
VFRNNKGLGLMEVIMASGLIGGLSLVILQMTQNSQKGVTALEIGTDIETTTKRIQQQLSDPDNCTLTLQNQDAKSTDQGVITGLTLKRVEPPNTVNFTVGMVLGQKRLKIKSYKISDSYPDVGVDSSNTTHFIISFDRGNKGLGTKLIERKIPIKVEVNTNKKILSCYAVSALKDTIWKYTTNNTGIYYNSGLVGIGIIDPKVGLHVVSEADNTSPHPFHAGLVVEAQGAGPGGRLASTAYSDSQYPAFVGHRSRGTKSAPRPVQENDILLALNGAGFDGSRWVNTAGVPFSGTDNIRSLATQTWTSSARGSKLILSTTPNNSTVGRIGLLLDQDGSVGIGTTSPGKLLHISANNESAGLIIERTSNNNSSPTLVFRKSRVGAGVLENDKLGSIFLSPNYSSSANHDLTIMHTIATQNHTATKAGFKIVFYTTPDDEINERARLTIEQNGFVGIGTNAPQARLHVNGTIALGNSTPPHSCGAPQEGQQRYNSNLKTMEFCNGLNWVVMGSNLNNCTIRNFTMGSNPNKCCQNSEVAISGVAPDDSSFRMEWTSLSCLKFSFVDSANRIQLMCCK